ncbi:putative Receptor-like protein kinase [Hibiscus syriacus]|uniref:Receptor-like protein kinase n=1 Tax=Hibiscus syriacus TaxID=106335 RepID=A0A6A3ALG1_HIBSY|nr:putative Receptor-like protein kinase [Hibiscus syriacus]
MRRFCLLLLVLFMVVLSESASVDCCRPLRSIKTIGVRVSLDSTENGRGRVLEDKIVATDIVAGPSRKGPGH